MRRLRGGAAGAASSAGAASASATAGGAASAGFSLALKSPDANRPDLGETSGGTSSSMAGGGGADDCHSTTLTEFGGVVGFGGGTGSAPLDPLRDAGPFGAMLVGPVLFSVCFSSILGICPVFFWNPARGSWRAVDSSAPSATEVRADVSPQLSASCCANDVSAEAMAASTSDPICCDRLAAEDGGAGGATLAGTAAEGIDGTPAGRGAGAVDSGRATGRAGGGFARPGSGTTSPDVEALGIGIEGGGRAAGLVLRGRV